jgi:DNA (cytosine-5)-methyltransferase 1
MIILGIRNDLHINPVLPDIDKEHQGLQNIISFSMKGAMKVEDQMFDQIPDCCVLTNMNNTEQQDECVHPYLRQKSNERNVSYQTDKIKHPKMFKYAMSFGKRVSPIHCEIIDIREPSKTIICTYERQPRLFVPLKNANGCFLRPLLPIELQQIQGFPADYTLCGTDKQKVVQIGNAVPPPLITEIVNSLKYAKTLKP